MSAGEVKEIARQLKIQTGVCRRLSKDVTSYQKEAADEKTAIDKMAENIDGADEQTKYKLKQAREAHAETMAMVEDSRNRLDDALPRLESLIASAKEKKLAELIPDDITAAETVVTDARKVLTSSQ